MAHPHHRKELPSDRSAPAWISDRYGRPALLAGVVGWAILIAGWIKTPQFYRAYLMGYLLWVGVSMGCMALLMVNHLSAGKWGLISRRVMEAASRLFPLLAILFIPILIGMWVGKWTHNDPLYVWQTWNWPGMSFEVRKIVEHKSFMMEGTPWILRWFGYNEYGFTFRAVLYFFIWWLLSSKLSRWSLERDADPSQDWQRRFENLSGPGVVIYAMTLTFAMFDWVLSLDPTWYSTIYALIFLAGQGLSALAVIIYTVITISADGPIHSLLRKVELHDLGKLVLAFVMLFAYLSFSQWLIIWSGNLPDEIGWYLNRISGGWGYVTIFGIVIAHFAIPFCLMLSRKLKKRPEFMLKFCIYLLLIRLVHLFWEVEPSFPNSQRDLSWHPSLLLYVVAPVAIGGIWVWAFIRELRSRPVFPAVDPQIPEILEPEHATA